MSELIYDLTVDDLIKATLRFAERSPTARRSRTISFGIHAGLFLVLGIPLCIAIGLPVWAALLISGVSAAASFLTNRYTWKWWAARTMRKMYREGQDAVEPGEQRLQIDDDGLHITSPKSTTTLSFDTIADIRRSENHDDLILNGTHVFPIPHSKVSMEALDAFTGELRHRGRELG